MKNKLSIKICGPLITLSLAYLLLGVPLIYPRGDDSLKIMISGIIFFVLYWIVCSVLIRRSTIDVANKDKALVVCSIAQVPLVALIVVLI